MSSQAIDEAVLERISASAAAQLNDLISPLARRQGQRMAAARQQYAFNEALVRLLPEEERGSLLGARQERGREGLLARSAEASEATRRRLADAVLGITRQAMPEAWQTQLLTPPYVGAWSPHNTTGDAEATAYAYTDGTFGFRLGTGDGGASALAGVVAQFIPDGPNPRVIQIRPYVQFADQWDSNTLGQPYGAHNEGGFGIVVMSWTMEGQDERVEEPFPWWYYNWYKDTGWFSEDHDTNWPNPDYGMAYTFGGNTPPPFIAWPERIYHAAVYCFGSCDAGGGFFGHGISASSMGASAGFIAIGEL